MEYAPNSSLRTKHPKGSQVPSETVVFYTKQVADALQYIHEQKLVHRDVKPENMLVGANNEVLLSDLGIAAVAHSTSSFVLQGQAGTAPYMAPEQIMEMPRPASDQYSLGIIIYEWLTGTLPFQGSTLSIINQHLYTPPPSLLNRLPWLSPIVESIVLRALAKDPKLRFPTVRAFATALEQACQLESSRPVILSTETAPTPQSLLPTGSDPSISRSQSPFPLDEVTPAGESSHSTNAVTPLSPFLHPTPVATSSPTPATPPHSIRGGVPSGIPQLHKQGISRRVVLLSLTGAAAVTLAGGGITWAILSGGNHGSHPLSASGLTATSASKAATSQPATSTSTTTASRLTSQGVLYIGSWFDHSTYALKMSDGTVLWHSQGGSHSDEAMAFANDVVYCGSDDHTVYALRASNGSLLWLYHTGGIINSPPTVSNGVVYIGSWDNFLYALKASDGSPLWSFQTSGEIHSSPVVIKGVVYFGSGDGSLYALHANDGSVVWRYQTGGAVYAWPTVVNGVVYIGSGDYTMYALQANDGSLRWRYQTGDAIYTTATVANGVVYTCSGDHHMYGLQADNGNLLRRYQIGQQGAAQPAVVSGVIYACSVDTNVYALRASDGSQIWRYQTAGFMGAKPVLVNGVIYVGGSSGLYALQASDGTLLWKFDGAVTAPAVS